jgi:tRNA modification GTPase
MTLDAVSTGIEQAVSQLSALTGERASEEIIARVFEKFCVGK